MSKRLELYSTIAGFIWQAGVRLNDLRNVETFIWAVTALIASGTVHLSVWSLYRNSKAKVASVERQFARWLHNKKVNVNEIYRALATLAWIDWTEEALELALDTTMLWDKYAVVRVAVVYRGRALPLGRRRAEQCHGRFTPLSSHAPRGCTLAAVALPRDVTRRPWL